MVYFGIFNIIILISICFINYYQEQILIFRGVIDEVDKIISELPGDEGVSIIVLTPHGKLVYGHSPPIPSFFPLKISRVNCFMLMCHVHG